LKLYKFYKNDCIPCRSLTKMLYELKLPDNIKLIELNVENEENREFAFKNNIRSVPTLLKENGEKLTGLKSIPEIKSFIGMED
jgi:thiol-disulfide isomerase/thioredoxin